MPQTRQQTRLIEAVKPVLEEHGVVRAELVGSYARGDNTGDSDVDIVVEMPEGASLFDLSGLHIALEDELDRDVDVMTYNGVHPRLEEYIFAHTVSIL